MRVSGKPCVHYYNYELTILGEEFGSLQMVSNEWIVVFHIVHRVKGESLYIEYLNLTL